jgi:hypothetical protein
MEVSFAKPDLLVLFAFVLKVYYFLILILSPNSGGQDLPVPQRNACFVAFLLHCIIRPVAPFSKGSMLFHLILMKVTGLILDECEIHCY